MSFDVSDGIEQAIQSLTDPITGSPSRGKAVSGIICLNVDDLFCVGDQKFYKCVISSIQKDVQMGSEDTNGVLFVGQRVCWKTEGSNSFIQVDQERCIAEPVEIKLDKGLPDTEFCSTALRSQHQSVLGQVNWLQSRTQYQACYRFSRCASASAGPIKAGVRALNKLVRSIIAEPYVLQYWPLKGSLRLVGYPDAPYRNNVDNNSQRGQAAFWQKKRPHLRMALALCLSLKHTILSW